MSRSPRSGVVGTNTTFGVVTADLVESRRLADRARVQRQLTMLTKSLNLHFKKALQSEFMITLGDEIQGLVGNVGQIPVMVQTIHDEFHPREIAVGIGVGRVSTNFSGRVTEMDGPVFVRARTAVESAKKMEREVVVDSGDPYFDSVLNSLYSLLGGIMRGWTKDQWLRAKMYRTLGTVEEVAKALGVAKQSVSKSLRNTYATRVHEVERVLPGVFQKMVEARAADEAQAG